MTCQHVLWLDGWVVRCRHCAQVWTRAQPTRAQEDARDTCVDCGERIGNPAHHSCRGLWNS